MKAYKGKSKYIKYKFMIKMLFLMTLTLIPSSAFAQGESCQFLGNDLAEWIILKNVLEGIVNDPLGNGGLKNNMWLTTVNTAGEVCAVVFSGSGRFDQWLASRVISAQKAYTANSLSLSAGARPGGTNIALSTANLYSAVQPGGTLFGLQLSNPVNAADAYARDQQGTTESFGTFGDPLKGKIIGGINVFGGGLALYTSAGQRLGALGVSGDTSCTDHIVAWKVRHALNLDNVPGGVSPTNDDNIVHDITLTAQGHPVSPSGFGHPTCDPTATSIANNLPTTHPIGPNP